MRFNLPNSQNQIFDAPWDPPSLLPPNSIPAQDTVGVRTTSPGIGAAQGYSPPHGVAISTPMLEEPGQRRLSHACTPPGIPAAPSSQAMHAAPACPV